MRRNGHDVAIQSESSPSQRALPLRSAQVEKAAAHAEDAHNYTLAVVSTMGLLGMMGFLSVVFSVIGFGFSRRSFQQRKEKNGKDRIEISKRKGKRKGKNRQEDETVDS